MEPDEDDPERLPEDSEPFPAKAPVGELELSDELIEKQEAAKSAGAEAFGESDFQKALESFTEAIAIGNVSAMLYARRADVLLKLKRPCACISDCDSALEINPDSAKAHRIRGKAYRALGKWEDAHKDISLSQKLDYDESLEDMHSLVAEKLKKSKQPTVQSFSLHESWREVASSMAREDMPESRVHCNEEKAGEEEDFQDEDDPDLGVEDIELEESPEDYQRATKPPPTRNVQPAGEDYEDEEHEQAESGPGQDETDDFDENDPGRLRRDAKPYLAPGPLGELELTDEQMDKQDLAKQAATEALELGQIEKALKSWTEAIMIGNATAAMYAKRAEALLKLKRPCACISDCGYALEINPDSAKTFRIRGKAYRSIGKWEESYNDFLLAQQLDYDDDLVDIQKFVTDKCSDIFEKKREERLKQDEIKEERFQENLLRRRKVYEQKLQEEEDARAEAEAKEKYERSFRGRCRACCRRMSGEGKSNTSSKTDEEQEEQEEQDNTHAQSEDID